MAGRLDGRVAIITGAAGGMGSATVAKFLHEGAKVLAVDLSAEALDRALEDSPAISRLALDITAADAAERIVAAAITAFGSLDILVNNAGIFLSAPTEATSDESWGRMMDVNITATFRLCRAAIPALRNSAHGRIVNIASVSAVRSASGMAAYGASKAAVGGLTRSLAIELGPDGITANSVLPGSVLTDMIRARFDDPAMRERLEGFSPLGRIGLPEDIANAVAFLASDEASFISGHGLAVDGGFLAKA